MQFEPTHDLTCALIPGSLSSYFDVQATLPDGSVVTPWVGDVTIIKDATQAASYASQNFPYSPNSYFQ